MNWYEHHIKDYAAATAHLTWDQDHAYTRMLRRYYRKEEPLPADKVEICRLIGAVTPEQQAAVDVVLSDFFELRADGWHNEKADEVIAAYHAGQPEREAKKRNEDTRLERHRAERARLFKILNAAGEHLPYNCPMAELRAKVETLPATPGVSGSVTGASKGVSSGVAGSVDSPSVVKAATQPATAPVTLATATHPPLPTTHSPISSPSPTPVLQADLPGQAAAADPVDKPKGIPDCDHEGVRKLWATLMPGNPQPEKWTETRASHLRARWRELFTEGQTVKVDGVEVRIATQDHALRWFSKYFRFLAKSRFLTGRAKSTPGRPTFVAELDWVLRPENFAKCLEGKYHQDE